MQIQLGWCSCHVRFLRGGPMTVFVGNISISKWDIMGHLQLWCFFFGWEVLLTESATKAQKTKLGVFSKPFFWAYHPKTSNMTLFSDHQRFSHLKLILRRTSDRCLVPVLCDRQALDIWWPMVISFQPLKKMHTDHEIPIPSPGNIRPDERMSPGTALPEKHRPWVIRAVAHAAYSLPHR